MDLNQYKKYVKIKKVGNIYQVFGFSANIIKNLTKLKIKLLNNKVSKIDIEQKNLIKVLSILDTNHINTVLYDDQIVKKEYPDNNFDKYKYIIKNYNYKEQPIISKKIMTGYVIVLYNQENDPEKYVIGENINSDSELIKKVIHYNIGDTILLNSGIKLKIIDKNIGEKNV